MVIVVIDCDDGAPTIVTVTTITMHTYNYHHGTTTINNTINYQSLLNLVKY
jgi:hypothetical protein